MKGSFFLSADRIRLPASEVAVGTLGFMSLGSLFLSQGEQFLLIDCLPGVEIVDSTKNCVDRAFIIVDRTVIFVHSIKISVDPSHAFLPRPPTHTHQPPPHTNH